MARRGPAVLAIGNALRGDDGAGIAVADRLAGRLPADIALITSRGDAAELMAIWEDRPAVALVDAVAGSTPGEVLCWRGAAEAARAGQWAGTSTHDFGLAQALALGELMGRLPRALVLIGVVGRDFTVGGDLSAPVRAVLEPAAERVIEEIQGLCGGLACTSNH